MNTCTEKFTPTVTIELAEYKRLTEAETALQKVLSDESVLVQESPFSFGYRISAINPSDVIMEQKRRIAYLEERLDKTLDTKLPTINLIKKTVRDL